MTPYLSVVIAHQSTLGCAVQPRIANRARPARLNTPGGIRTHTN